MYTQRARDLSNETFRCRRRRVVAAPKFRIRRFVERERHRLEPPTRSTGGLAANDAPFKGRGLFSLPKNGQLRDFAIENSKWQRNADAP